MQKEKKPLYDPATGIHRAKVWEIAFFALNNTSTNLYYMAFMYITYFLVGIVGVGVVMAGSLATVLRVWDGITDPFIGFIVDKTNSKFGKNRPFVVLGQLFMLVFSALIFLICPNLPKAARLPFYIVCYMLYIIGYTCQCVVTKSAQSCLTNDPKQRPLFSVFDTIFNMTLWMVVPSYIASVMVPKYDTGEMDAFSNPAFFRDLWIICAIAAMVTAIFTIIGIWRKDREEYFGTGAPQRLRLRDYWEVLKNNRAIQMLCVSACSDKVASGMQTSGVVMVMLFGVIVGNYSTYSAFNVILSIGQMIVMILLLMFVARNMGQKQALLLGTYGGIVGAVCLFFLLCFGDPTQISFTSVNMYTVVFMLLFIIMKGFGGLSGTIVLPMTADCADYEVYRSGRYVPGLMGTLFSFIDKLISSLSTTFVALLLAAIGFTDTQPTYSTPYSDGIFWVTMLCLLGAPIIGWILNVVALRFYPLSKDMMASIQNQIAEIKAGATQKEPTQQA